MKDFLIGAGVSVVTLCVILLVSFLVRSGEQESPPTPPPAAISTQADTMHVRFTCNGETRNVEINGVVGDQSVVVLWLLPQDTTDITTSLRVLRRACLGWTTRQYPCVIRVMGALDGTYRSQDSFSLPFPADPMGFGL